MSKLFGPTGLTSLKELVDYDISARDISTDHPEFSDYFNNNLKDRLRQFVVKPKNDLEHCRLWTNNNCESINHVFRRTINWQHKPIPELVAILHDLIRSNLT